VKTPEGGRYGEEGAEADGKRFAERDEALPVVLLAHDPGTFKRASQSGVDLQLSGHTHGGQIKLHVRARTGTRIEETAALCDAIEATIHKVIPKKELSTVVDNLGLPYSGINLAYSTSAPVGPGDADIFVNLKEGHRPTAGYVRELRKRLSADFPSTTFSFLPADMITQILNFGLPSPIDVQIVGFNVPANRAFANALLQRLHSVPGVVDLHIHQTGDYPQFNVDVDRTRLDMAPRYTSSSLPDWSDRGYRSRIDEYWIPPV
jgi:multidrug efflux pump subunit AcrB